MVVITQFDEERDDDDDDEDKDGKTKNRNRPQNEKIGSLTRIWVFDFGDDGWLFSDKIVNV